MASNKQVALNWFTARNSGRKSSNGNLWFETDDNGHEVIYSYGRHFPIAKRLGLHHGVDSVLMTTRGYSVSTSKHISYVQSVLSAARLYPLQVFYVPNPNASFADNATRMRQDIKALEDDFNKRRPGTKIAKHLADQLDNAIKQLALYHSAFGPVDESATDAELLAVLVA